MTFTAALLVILSATTHAYWNFLLKRSGGTQLFVGLSKVGEVVMFAPFFLALVAPKMARFDGLFILAAFAAACYTLWDKHAVQRVPAFAYIYLYTAITAIAYGAFIWRRYPRTEVARQWRTHRWPILQVGFLNITSYLLVLVALRT